LNFRVPWGWNLDPSDLPKSQASVTVSAADPEGGEAVMFGISQEDFTYRVVNGKRIFFSGFGNTGWFQKSHHLMIICPE